MTRRDPGVYRSVADAAWRWVLAQVQDADGPWIPGSVAGTPGDTTVPDDRDGMHSGIGGLAHVLAELRLARAWTGPEQELASAVTERLVRVLAEERDCSLFDGLPSHIGALSALDVGGVDAAVARLTALAAPDGWPQSSLGPPRFLPGTRINDATLGTAAVLLAALWARRLGVPRAAALADQAVGVLMAEAEETESGTSWGFVPVRFRTGPGTEMPNFSHGVAGVASALAVAGAELGRPELVDAARHGAAHLIALGDASGGGFVVPRYLPVDATDEEPVTYTWCHGCAGTSLLFRALEVAGVEEVAGVSPASWHGRCLHSIRSSGLPARLRPGFWDNDGRCCGTAGVGDTVLDSWHCDGDDLDLALRQADALVERAVRQGPHAYWRFVEHRADQPLLAPGVGWMQGAAGIAAFLFRVARVLEQGRDAPAVTRMDNWWALPPGSDPGRRPVGSSLTPGR